MCAHLLYRSCLVFNSAESSTGKSKHDDYESNNYPPHKPLATRLFHHKNHLLLNHLQPILALIIVMVLFMLQNLSQPRGTKIHTEPVESFKFDLVTAHAE
jgi:hypothetical protein